uniref:AMP-dependent synthetase/ligase domain-containing protein n=1 Tax=Parascaris equorum TaxID=6256 RepID=A0A914RQ13_PAREQ
MPIKSQLADIEIPHIPFHDLIIDSLKKYGTNVALVSHLSEISMSSLITAVILCVPNCPDFAWLFLGISMAGGIVCPLHPTFSIDEMRLQISDSAARFAFAVPSALSNLSAVFCELDIVHRMPMSCHVQVNIPSGVCVSTMRSVVMRCSVRVLFLNPLILRKLCSSEIATKYSLSSLKAIIIGTAAADDETMKVAYKFLSSVRRYSSVYGMTEMGSVCRSTKSSSFNIHSCGSLCANLSMKRGLILISGPTVISPYWNNQKATMEDFKYSGWRNTGRVSPYKRLMRVVIALTIPRSPSGRILRRMLREAASLYI